MTILWILNLFNGTGLGMVYQTTEKTRSLIYIAAIFIIIMKCREHHLWVDKQDFIIFGGMAFIFIAVSMFKGNGAMGLHYLTAFLLIYCLSKLNVYEKTVKLTGLVYAAMGLGVLYIYDYGSILSGWNGNTIGMTGLYSFLFFLISFHDVNSIRSKVIVVALTLIYIYLIIPTDSRSCTWFAIIAVLFVLLENDKNRGIVLSLNKGLDAATGKYIARMDADDIALKNRFERQVEYLDEHKDIGVLGTGICTFGEKIKEQKRVFTTNAEQLKAELLFNSCIAHPTVMIRKSVLQKYNLKYNTEFAGAEDYCLWWNIAKVSKIATLLYNQEYFRERIYIDENGKTNDLREIDWTNCVKNPHIYTIQDWEKLNESKKFFARKFDINKDPDVIFKIYNQLKID